MVGIDLTRLLGFPQRPDFMLRWVAKVLADLNHDHRLGVERLQQRTVEPSKLVGSTICLGQLDLQQQDITWQLDVDIRLAVVAPCSISESQPLIVVNELRLQKGPLEMPNHSAFVGLAFGSTPFQLRAFLSPGATLQNLDVPQVHYLMTVYQRLGH